jgi:hypothetical protein
MEKPLPWQNQFVLLCLDKGNRLLILRDKRLRHCSGGQIDIQKHYGIE